MEAQAYYHTHQDLIAAEIAQETLELREQEVDLAKYLVTPRLAQEFTALMDEAGVTLADLLQGLEEERALIWQERTSNRV